MAFDFDLFSVSDEEYSQGMEAAAEACHARQEKVAEARRHNPRAYKAWDATEERLLLEGYRAGLSLEQLAHRHGRTETAVSMRLEHLGVSRARLIAMDFDPVPAEAPTPTDLKDPLMHLTLNRLLLLMEIHRGTYRSSLSYSGKAADLSRLVVAGLVEVPPHNGPHAVPPSLTPAGEAAVKRALDASNEGNVKPSRTVGLTAPWDEDRQTFALEGRRFWLVANGDVSAGQYAYQLKNPPRVVQPSEAKASDEAERLARLNPGTPFFVLQAVAVHHVQPAPPPATAKRL